MSYKVGIIGAARRHQGTGPYIARNFAQLGHKVAGILGTSESSTLQTCKQLLKDYAIHTQPYTDLDQLVAEQNPDIIVISTPPSSHLQYIQQALEHHCHIFCEKPFWWPADCLKHFDADTYLSKVESVIKLAQERHCYIHLNTQWPYTLKDFFRLHPGALSKKAVNQFAMHLSPQSQDTDMLVDAASHGLSMLYQLVGKGDIEDIQINKSMHNASINFDYTHATGRTNTTLSFIQSDETPKPASYQINDFGVKRLVRLPEYQIQLQSAQQTIDIQDPLDASIKDFLAAIVAQVNTDESSLLQGALHLYQLIDQYTKS